LGTPSTAEYIAIGDTVTRFSTSISRNLKGANIGGAVLFERPSVARFQNQRSTPSSHSRSRSRRFSWLMRWLRVSSE
jgi:hypothetical protein